MPFYDDEKDFKEEDNTEASGTGQPIGAQSAIISGQGSNPSAAQNSSPNATTPQAGDRSGSFVNLKDYLNANKSQANKLGSQVAGQVEGQVEDATKAVGTFEEAGKKASSSPVQIGEDTFNTISNQADKLTEQEKIDIKKAQQGYQGIQDFTQVGNLYTDAASATDKAEESLGLSQTEEGRQDLIKNLNPQSQRTSGMNVFDAMLLQTGGGREKLNEVFNKNPNVFGNLNTAIGNVQSNIETNKEASEALKSRIASTVGQRADSVKDDPSTPDIDESKVGTGAFGILLKYLQDKAGGIDPKTAYNTALGALAGDTLPEEVRKALGLEVGDSLYDIDLSNYVSQNPAAATIQDVAGAEEVARYQALLDLAGASEEGDKTLSKPGSYTPVSYNSAGLEAALEGAGGKEGAYKTVLTNEAAPIKDALNYFAAGGYDLAANGLDINKIGTSYEDAKAQLDAFEAKLDKDPAFKAFLNGAPPPGFYGWDSGTQARYRQRYSFYPLLKNYVDRLGKMNPTRKVK